MTLDPRQIEAFREQGFFHLGRVFDEDELAEIRGEYDRIVATPMKVGEEGKTPFLYSPLLQLQSPVLRRYCTAPALAAAAVDLLGPDIRLYWDQAVYKPAGADSHVPWHQDNGYTPVEPEEYVTFTLAVDAASEANGCLWIQPGSHTDGVKPHEKNHVFFFEGEAGDDPGVPCPQPEGDVLAFSSLTMHRSQGNTSETPRRSWIIQLCRADTRHAKTGKLLDDRLWVAKDGKPVDEPWSERPFDIQALLESEKSEKSEKHR